MKSKKPKFLTRRDIQLWFQPITDFCKVALNGEVDSVKGYPITYIASRKVYCYAHVAIEGFKETALRITTEFDLNPLCSLSKKLEHGITLETKDLTSVITLMRKLEDKFIRIRAKVLHDAYITQLTYIEVERMNLCETLPEAA